MADQDLPLSEERYAPRLASREALDLGVLGRLDGGRPTEYLRAGISRHLLVHTCPELLCPEKDNAL